MKACPISIRKNAIEHYHGNDISENDRKMNDKFFYYLQAYCCEMKFFTIASKFALIRIFVAS